MSVIAVCRSSPFALVSKRPQPYINLLKDRGVQYDKHCSPRCDSSTETKPETSIPDYLPKDMTTLRQVHLISAELIAEINRLAHYRVANPDPIKDEIPMIMRDIPFITGRFSSGALGENITTFNIDLLNLPIGTRLQFRNRDPAGRGDGAVIRITGYRYMEGTLEYLLCDVAEHFLVREGIAIRGFRPRTEAGDIGERKPIGVFGVVERGGHVLSQQIIRIMEEEEELSD